MARDGAPGTIILCADDFALTHGVSEGIRTLALAERLSATSALVTTPHWPAHGEMLAALGQHIALGLHLDLTLGPPLGPMPVAAPGGRFRPLPHLVRSALLGPVDRDEIKSEVLRQIDRFTSAVGAPPDFVDGHQHVHALPRIRQGVIAALVDAFPGRHILVRDPADSITAIARRGGAVAKSLALTALVHGFGAAVRRAGFTTNEGFSGVSAFDRGVPFARELDRFMTHPGRRHLVMCHPGRVDAELATRDPVVERRQDELDAIAASPTLAPLLWRPVRNAGGEIINWPGPATP